MHVKHPTGDNSACQSSHHIHTLKDDIEGDGLRWTQARAMADVVSAAFRMDSSERVQKWGERISNCGQHITVAYDPEDGGYRRRVVQAQLCRVRACPICAWRRAERLAADVGQVIRKVCKPGELLPLMLTLTVKNCSVSELRETIQKMLSGWSRLRKRKVFIKNIIHWTRSIEITRGRGHIKDDTHPHMHCILLAHPDEAVALLSTNWSSVWAEVMHLEYNPVTHIMPLDVQGNVAEPLKYTVKPHHLAEHAVSGWLARVALALDGIRVFACDEGLRLHEPTGEENDGGILIDTLPDGVPHPARRIPLSIVYHWTGQTYIRGCISLGFGVREIRALQLSFRRR